MQLSIIIPTHKRRDILRQCLECIGKQTLLRSSGASKGKPFAQDIEVVVVSDGPDEKTSEMIASLSWPFEIQHFAIPKSQQGVARNRAVEKARGKYSLLISDDIFLAEDACERHLNAHGAMEAPNPKHQAPNKHQIPSTKYAVLGFTTWDPSLKITPLMRWMEESGVQFGYPLVAPFTHTFLPETEQHFFTYASNLSLPTKILWQHPFREDALLYGWEDVEWGRRLAQSGVRLFYEPDARGYHHHPFTDAEVWERSRTLGQSAAHLERALAAEGDVDLRIVPHGIKKFLYTILSFLPTYRGKHWRAFLRGVRTLRDLSK